MTMPMSECMTFTALEAPLGFYFVQHVQIATERMRRLDWPGWMPKPLPSSSGRADRVKAATSYLWSSE